MAQKNGISSKNNGNSINQLESKRTVICSLYSGVTLALAITKFSPTRLILLCGDKNKPTQALAQLELFKKIMECHAVTLKTYDLVETATQIAQLIEGEHKKGQEVILNLSEGRKIMFLAGLYGASIRREMVKGAYYISEDQQIIKLPLIPFKVSKAKEIVLQELAKGHKKIKHLAQKLNLSQSMVYAHINDLIKEGHVDNNLQLTESGRLLLI